MNKLAFLLALSAVFALNTTGQTVLGKWKTIDDETGKEKSIVEIYEQNGVLYGKIIQLFREPGEEQDPVCDKCEDDRKGQKIKGMVIIRDMKLKDGYYQGGTIIDPKNGRVYKCELWLQAGNPNKLELRGYWGWFYRTQTWVRI
ncbi:MAG: DUF2147 domain-containing protein [Flavobacteriales bacterium]